MWLIEMRRTKAKCFVREKKYFFLFTENIYFFLIYDSLKCLEEQM